MNRNGAEQNWRDLGDVMVFEWKLQAYSYSHEFLQLSHVRGVQLLPVSEFPSTPATGPQLIVAHSAPQTRRDPHHLTLPSIHMSLLFVRVLITYRSLFLPQCRPCFGTEQPPRRCSLR